MKRVFACLMIFAFISTPLFAAIESSWTQEETYKEKCIEKLNFGVVNFLFGWTEIYTKPWEAHDNEKNVAAGVVKGLSYGFADTFGGIFHAATFLIPIDLPLPNGGTHYLEK